MLPFGRIAPLGKVTDTWTPPDPDPVDEVSPAVELSSLPLF